MSLKKTKIVATLGPASSSREVITEMVLAGMNVARLNFSHGTLESMQQLFDTVRSVSKELGIPVAIVADLQGPKLRLGEIDGIMAIKKGDEVNLSISPKGNEIPIQFDLSRHIIEGHRISINDGLIELKVVGVEGQTVKTIAQNNGKISSHKGVNIPDTRLGIAAFTEKDRQDAQFALKNKADYIALSFVEVPEDVVPATEMIKKSNPATKVIVKIERREALNNLEKIIEVADSVMVARGDLATETSPAEVPIFQQKIIRLARQLQKPVIVATQMLESMNENPRPTRAEASDVANAVLIQADAVMLSAESASGKYPLEAVKTMSEIIVSVEEHLDFKQYIRINWENLTTGTLEFNAIAASAASLSYRISAPLIVVATATGKTAQLISSFRPSSNIVAATHDEQTKNQLSLIWGVTPIVVGPVSETDVFWNNIIGSVKQLKFAESGSRLVLVGGSANIGVSGATDTIKVVTL